MDLNSVSPCCKSKCLIHRHLWIYVLFLITEQCIIYQSVPLLEKMDHLFIAQQHKTKIFQSIWCIHTSNKQTMRKAKMRFTMNLEQGFLGGIGHLSCCCLQIRAKIAPLPVEVAVAEELRWQRRWEWTQWRRRLLLSSGSRSKVPLPGSSPVLEVHRAREGGR